MTKENKQTNNTPSAWQQVHSTSDILKCKHHTHVPWSGCVLLGQNSKNVNYHNKLSHVNCLSIYTLLGVQEKFSFE